MEDKYLSDEELLKLIADTENNHMLKAPSYLKDEILSCVDSIEVMESEFVEPAEIRPVKKMNSSSKMELIFYSLKVCVAMVAAIIIVFLIPADKVEPSQENNSVFSMMTQQMNEKTNKLCDVLNSVTNKVISGGYDNEE